MIQNSKSIVLVLLLFFEYTLSASRCNEECKNIYCLARCMVIDALQNNKRIKNIFTQPINETDLSVDDTGGKLFKN